MSGDQLVHMLRHVSSQGGDLVPFRYGHVANYDPTQHRARVIIPSMTDDTGQPLLSGWMPVSTMSSGVGYGVQVILQGGATADNPTGGEQVLVGVFDRQRGVAAVLAQFYHGNAPPPATNLPTQKDGFGSDATAAVPGDVIISAPPATSGGANSFVRLRQSGVIEIWAAGAVNADVQGPVNIVAEGTNPITIQAAGGVVNILGAAVRLGRAATDTLKQLLTIDFWTNFNVHTHGAGPVPDQPATQAMLTQTTTAE